MMREYKRYEEYQDSGVEWIGEIPEEWKVVKLKFITECLDNLRVPLNSTERAEMKGNIPYWGANSIVDYVNDWLVDEEVILLGEDGAPFFDKLKNVAFYSNEKIWPNNHVHVLRVNNQNEIKYLIYSLNITDYTEFITGSTRDKLNQSAMSEIPLQLPSQNEQQKIVSFLDQKTAKIDEIINKKETLIDYLEKYKKSVITEAVTKGKLGNKYISENGELVDEIEMKDSGVDWVGEIPEYWEVNRIKFNNLINPNKSEINYKDMEVSFVPMEYIKDGVIEAQDLKKLDEVYAGYSYFTEQDILLAKVTPCFENNNIGIASDLKNGIGFGTTEVHVIRALNDFNRYIFYLFQSKYFKNKGKSVMYGAGGLKRVPTDFVENYFYGRPEYEIQKLISKYLDLKTKQIDTLIQKTKTSIQKYKEYKKSLIFEAVTGKIDLRDYELKGGE